MSHNPGRPIEVVSPMPSGIAKLRHAAFDDEAKARNAATNASEYRSPIDPDAKNIIRVLADIFRKRARARWNTPLPPETTILMADALDDYAPVPVPAYEYRD